MTINEKIASVLKALGHPTRLMIVRELLTGQKCVGEVESLLNIRQANASQHLSILKINGIAECKRQGNQRLYSIKEPKKFKKLIDVIELK